MKEPTVSQEDILDSIDRLGATALRIKAERDALLEACRATLKAMDELMTEFVSKKRAADWGVIHGAGVAAAKAIAKAEGQ
jgi:hypothetical protein